MTRRRSWVDALFDAVEHIPGPPWLLYAALTVAAGAASIGMRFADGSVAFEPISPVITAFALLTFMPWAVAHYISRAAVRSMADYRPALGELEPEAGVLVERLTTMPHWASIVAPVVGVSIWLSGQLTAVTGWGITEHTAISTDVVTMTCGLILNIGFMIFVFRAVRQTITIADIHRRSTNIRLWETAPHVAFSRLTFAMAVSLTVPFAIAEILAVAFNQGSIVEIVVFVAALVLAVVIFTLPLSGMHRALVREEEQLLAESNRSFETAGAALRTVVEAGEFSKASPINDALAGLAAQHERLRRLSTWPWSAETLRNFVSSLGLPVLIWITTAVLGRVLGF